MKKNFKNRGFMMIEILIASSIIAVSILAAMAVSQKSIQVARQSLHASQASFLLEEGAEVTKILRDNSWNNISILTPNTDYYPTFVSPNWSLSSTPNSIGIFTRTVRVSNINRDDNTKDIADVGSDDPGTKLITITVSWSEGGSIINKTLSFYLLDIFS
ncbi:MAG: hypothetical protein WC783_05175 [Candidatus Paceibacterota bacterium]|jgi:Tfp pilus assembly protein PilV